MLGSPSREPKASQSRTNLQSDALPDGELEEAGKLGSELKVERPFFLPGILLGTSAFTAAGWEGSFYPSGMKSDFWIEEQTKTWDKAIVDWESDLNKWVDLLREMVMNKKLRKLFAFANNHYVLCRRRYGPARTVTSVGIRVE